MYILLGLASSISVNYFAHYSCLFTYQIEYITLYVSYKEYKVEIAKDKKLLFVLKEELRELRRTLNLKMQSVSILIIKKLVSFLWIWKNKD